MECKVGLTVEEEKRRDERRGRKGEERKAEERGKGRSKAKHGDENAGKGNLRAEEEGREGKESKTKQGMNAKFQIDRVDPSNLPIKRPLAKTKTILTVSHNTDFSAHSVPMSVLPNSTKHSLHHPT